MSLNGIAVLRLAKCCFLLCAMAFTMAPSKCGVGGNGRTANLPPGITRSDLQAAASVFRQRTETEDMVRRFKKGNFNAAQVEFVMSEYDGPLAKTNAALDRIRRDIDATPTEQDEAAFRSQARDAVGDCVVLDSLLEMALRPGVPRAQLGNYVLLNADSLTDSWVTVWKASRRLSPADKQQFLALLEKELKWKTWQAIK